jgi:enamine deaminase RidA (YjgF/YER057c/UK114 family)
MSNFLSKKLLSLNLKRKNEAISLANYKPFVIFDKLIFISGQLPFEKNKLKFIGKIDTELSDLEAQQSIFLSTNNLLWNLNDAIDEFKINRIKCLNLKGYLNCTKNFKNHSILFDISSNLVIQALGEVDGSHSRSVIGVNSLPKESPVEIDGIFGILD